ncbi:hypothetical protein FS837_010325 [Tulasnella sp. UAMH 9824]|nr:hypothetical protein FS837_010325 [Tulasnella sp. UAMH 9824]
MARLANHISPQTSGFISAQHSPPQTMDTEIAVQDILQDISPPLELSWGLLKDIIETAADLPRNTQKTLHFILRVTEILKALHKPFSEPPLDLDDMMTAMESLRTLERTLIGAKSLIEKEAKLSTTYSEESKSTWFAHRDKLYKLVTAVYASEFGPPDGWEEELQEAARVDDHLWIGLIAHDMWDKSDLKDAGLAEQLAAKLLDEPPNDKEATNRKREVEKVMETWESIQADPQSSSGALFDFSLSSFVPTRSRSTSRTPPRQGSPTRSGSFLKTLQRVTSQRKGSSGFSEIQPSETPSDGDSSAKPQRPALPAPGKGGNTEPSQNKADLGSQPSRKQTDIAPKPSRKQTDVAPGPSNAQQSEPTTDPVSSIVNPTKLISLSSNPDLRRAAGQAIDSGEAQDASADEGAQE